MNRYSGSELCSSDALILSNQNDVIDGLSVTSKSNSRWRIVASNLQNCRRVSIVIVLSSIISFANIIIDLLAHPLSFYPSIIYIYHSIYLSILFAIRYSHLNQIGKQTKLPRGLDECTTMNTPYPSIHRSFTIAYIKGHCVDVLLYLWVTLSYLIA